MRESYWAKHLARLIALQEQAAIAEGEACAQFESELERVEKALSAEAAAVMVTDAKDAQLAVRIVQDIIKTEALRPLRDGEILRITSAVEVWASTLTDCDSS